jgi:hypothetical protein
MQERKITDAREAGERLGRQSEPYRVEKGLELDDKDEVGLKGARPRVD